MWAFVERVEQMGGGNGVGRGSIIAVTPTARRNQIGTDSASDMEGIKEGLRVRRRWIRVEGVPRG